MLFPLRSETVKRKHYCLQTKVSANLKFVLVRQLSYLLARVQTQLQKLHSENIPFIKF